MVLRSVLPLLLALCALTSGIAHAWNVTGHREVIAVAWSALDATTQNHIHQLLASQRLIPDTQGPSVEANWMSAALWPDTLREKADNTSTSDRPPASARQWISRASTGESTRRWHFADRDIAKPFERQNPQGLLEQALLAQIRLLGDPSLPRHERAIALAWVSHLLADAHQPLHCASRGLPGRPGELDAGGNLVTVTDAGRKPPDPISLHRWWDELPGQARPNSSRFNQDLVRLLGESLQVTENDLIKPVRVWIEASFEIARDHVYPGLLPDIHLPGSFLIRQDYWLESRRITQMQLALAGRRLAYVVTQALKDLPPR